MDYCYNHHRLGKVQLGEHMKYWIGILLFSIFLSGCAIENCNTNLNCFKDAIKTCSRAKVNIQYEDNDVRLTSRGTSFGSCKVSVKIEKVGEKLRQKDPTLASLAEGNTLNCAIPLEALKSEEKIVDNLLQAEQKFNQYCTGPIKDALAARLGK